MYKKIALLLLVLVLSLSVAYAETDSTLTEDAANVSPDESIAPNAVAHPCHSGTDHRRCETEYFPEPCGCLYGTYNCCCGRTMGYFYMPCDEHGYTAGSQSMLIIPADGASVDKEDVKAIFEKHSDIKEKIEKMSDAESKAAVEADNGDLTQQADDALKKIKELQK